MNVHKERTALKWLKCKRLTKNNRKIISLLH